MDGRIYPDLRTYFKERGHTQQKLARRLGISQPYMSNITNNIQQPPLDLALRISTLVGVPLESLLREPKVETAETAEILASDNE